MKIPTPVRRPGIHVTLLVLLAGLIVWLAPARSASADGPRPLQPEDVALLRAVGDPQLSPDGASVAYTVGTMDLAKDKRATNLWLARWDGSENRALTTGDNKQSHPRWSPDGKTLAFLSSRTDEHEDDQLWLLPINGGEAERVTEIKGGVEDFAWSHPIPSASRSSSMIPTRAIPKATRRTRKLCRRLSSTASSSSRTSKAI